MPLARRARGFRRRFKSLINRIGEPVTLRHYKGPAIATSGGGTPTRPKVDLEVIALKGRELTAAAGGLVEVGDDSWILYGPILDGAAERLPAAQDVVIRAHFSPDPDPAAGVEQSTVDRVNAFRNWGIFELVVAT